jgi:biopolymer transport protein ExbB
LTSAAWSARWLGSESVEFLQSLSPVGLLTLVLLLVCSLLVTTVGLERWAVLRRLSADPDWWQAQLHYFLKDDRLEPCRAYVASKSLPVAVVCQVGLNRAHLKVEETEAAMAAEIARQRAALEGRLPVIGTVAVVAPFIGLFGTVVGIMATFEDVAQQGQAGIEVVSAGVSEALVATAAGLLVAIAAVVLFNVFKGRISGLVLDMQLAAQRTSEMLELRRQQVPFPADLLTGAGEDAAAFDRAAG